MEETGRLVSSTRLQDLRLQKLKNRSKIKQYNKFQGTVTIREYRYKLLLSYRRLGPGGKFSKIFTVPENGFAPCKFCRLDKLLAFVNEVIAEGVNMDKNTRTNLPTSYSSGIYTTSICRHSKRSVSISQKQLQRDSVNGRLFFCAGVRHETIFSRAPVTHSTFIESPKPFCSLDPSFVGLPANLLQYYIE